MEEGISVIMPTFNQAGFIRRAIFSLLAQNYQKWELIIIWLYTELANLSDQY
ncbi:glycosyltransferase [Proteiniphilum sp. X52]|uniref:glycosyltransferase n=1 Tax=Proteiniphilum sp. X52 TaxID=2382159 RepID=UPI000F0A116C|nr:glycosyltransferase [Proteiniphilum sp. X52]RNC65309.1 glycosyltransferase [Proteiniphilum sp. X52]